MKRKSKILAVFLVLFSINFNYCQGVNPEIAVQSATVNTGQSADISFRSNNGEFWNIWQFNGTITWDPTVCTFNGFTSAQLFQMSLANFDTTLVSNGILIWAWTHMISIGQSVPQGDEIFTLNFRALGSAGASTSIGFANSPQALYWNNFAGWSGTIDTIPGTFTIAGCPPTNASFSYVNNGLDFTFNNNSTSTPPQSWYWDFGDGTNSTLINPSHSYLNDSTYNVCLYVTDTCGSDTTCQLVNPCFLPTVNFSSTGNGLQWSFTDNSTAGPNTSWHWDFGNGDSSALQNPNYTYVLDNTYTVCLTITDDCGQKTLCDSIYAYDNTGVHNFKHEKFQLFPNPTNGVFNITSNDTFLHIQLITLTGELVLEKYNYNSPSLSLDISDFEKGIYLLKISDDEFIYTHKIIKK
jgi:PKD repeat protein